MLSRHPTPGRSIKPIRPITDKLALGRTIGTKQDWLERRRLIEPLVVESMCEVAARQLQDKTSLGMFRPGEVLDLVVEKETTEWNSKHEAVIAQPSLFAPDKKGLMNVPYRFKFRYRCVTAGCAGHEQTIVDWEIAQAFLSWTDYSVAERLVRIRRRWLEDLCGPSRDAHFYVGNQNQHPGSFLVLGVFWPPKVRSPERTGVSPRQLPLDLA